MGRTGWINQGIVMLFIDVIYSYCITLASDEYRALHLPPPPPHICDVDAGVFLLCFFFSDS